MAKPFITRTVRFFQATIIIALVFFGYRLSQVSASMPVIVEVDRVEPTMKDLVRQIPSKYGIPWEVVQTVLEKESAGGKPRLKRFEPHHLVRYGYKISSDPETAREYASSHCEFQIMGWHLKLDEKGRKVNHGEWPDLYRPEVCVKQFARIMRSCLDKHGDAPSRYAQLERSFECYNGGKEYAAAAMKRVAVLAVGKI